MTGTTTDGASNNATVLAEGIEICRAYPTVTITSPVAGPRTAEDTVVVSIAAPDIGSGVPSVMIGDTAVKLIDGDADSASVALDKCGLNIITVDVRDHAGCTSLGSVDVCRDCGQMSVPMISQ